jgi:ankyrin repeat protein
MKASRRSESAFSLKKPTLSKLADDIRSDQSPPNSPTKRLRQSAHFNQHVIPLSINTPERKKTLRRSASIGDLLDDKSPKGGLKLCIERRKSRFYAMEEKTTPIENIRPPTPSFVIDSDQFIAINLTTKLHAVCAGGKAEQLSQLLDKSDEMDPNKFLDLNSKHLDSDCNRCTLMHTAAKHGRVPIMHLLWARGSSVDTLDTLDASPLVSIIFAKTNIIVLCCVKWKLTSLCFFIGKKCSNQYSRSFR